MLRDLEKWQRFKQDESSETSEGAAMVEGAAVVYPGTRLAAAGTELSEGTASVLSEEDFELVRDVLGWLPADPAVAVGILADVADAGDVDSYKAARASAVEGGNAPAGNA